jgi:RNA polymerase subunit RPABC4/transcription elongation factor Spt4
MSTGILKAFYNSDKWQNFRLVLIAERGPACQKCGKIIGNPSDCTAHHKTELTPENVGDVMISLNPENILIVCRTCHDLIHHRFCRHDHAVYIVYGPPMSGKSTFVREQMGRGDLVVDINALFAAVTMLPEYDKPDNLFSNVIGIYNLLTDNIKTRYGKWGSAWIIGGLPDKYRREQLANDLGAELIFCDVSKAECLARLLADDGRRLRGWDKYIDDWFERYTA